MECNKEEALRAKKIAERKITERDYNGARKFALKARTLNPELVGVSQLLTSIDVYIAVENKINSNDRNLHSALRPDNNQVVGADGALKLVLETGNLLPNRGKRVAYNEELNSKQPLNHLGQSGVLFASSGANNIHTSTANANLHAMSHISTLTSPASVSLSSGQNPWYHNSTPRMNLATAPSSSSQNPGTFWTICNKCKTHYEYLRLYVNRNLLCPSCHEAFLALEKSPPSVALMSPNLSSGQERQNSRPRSANRNLFVSRNSRPQSANRNLSISANSGPQATSLHNSWGPTSPSLSDNEHLQFGTFYRHGQRNEASYSRPIEASASASLPTEVSASVARRSHGKSKRKREEAQTASKGKKVPDNCAKGNRGDMALRIGVGSGSTYESRKGSFAAGGPHGFLRIYNKPNSRRELSTAEAQNMLASKALGEIRTYLENFNSVTKANGKEKMNMKEKESRKQKNMVNGELHDLSEHNGSNEKNQNKEVIPESSGDDLDEEAPPAIFIVPDSDFHNFDLDRTESSFKVDQVWAVYDNEDGMPRFYAKINDVISLQPFKMRMSWLNWRSNSELGPPNWVDSGFTKTCGDFRVGKQEFTEILNSFSHNVEFTKGTRGVIHIYPSKGDVWALYRNWSPDWDENTPDEVIRKYDMVEVLDDYSEEKGVSVIPLVKVDGFKTVFCQQSGPGEVKTIPKKEMFRFSHQVPGHLLTGLEAENAPSGCWELDPAATPLDLLQVSTETNAAPLVEEVCEELLQDVVETIAYEVGESSSKAGEGEV